MVAETITSLARSHLCYILANNAAVLCLYPEHSLRLN